ncbi:Pantothenate kinase type III, CoaX-like [hydrothermal vent metagenome]|uniref:Type III pantothenate kinase n=1 Tax=hydrothermal vent metagenome TaxID=652676 RepID=A0A3B0Z8Y0_9ZZZZ
MKLVVDVGNSRIKWAFSDEGVLHDVVECKLPMRRYDSFLKKQWGSLQVPESVIVSNVAKADMMVEIERWVTENWSVPTQSVVAEEKGWGVCNVYRAPERLGADRWAGMIAARRISQRRACCIIDCGTAITIDAISDNGQHQGGLILPGITLMRDALCKKTVGVKLDEEPCTDASLSLLARETTGAVTGGTLYAAVASIDRIMADVRAELGGRIVCIITGGDAPVILPLLSGNYEYKKDLVLDGLAQIAQAKK